MFMLNDNSKSSIYCVIGVLKERMEKIRRDNQPQMYSGNNYSD